MIRRMYSLFSMYEPGKKDLQAESVKGRDRVLMDQ